VAQQISREGVKTVTSGLKRVLKSVRVVEKRTSAAKAAIRNEQLQHG
jgi:hypothetical protein